MSYTYWYAPLRSDGGGGFETNSVGSATGFLGGISSMMEAAGWDVYDTNFLDDAEEAHVPVYNDYRVWVSRGESGDKVPGYLHMWFDVLLRPHFRACAYWSLTTHLPKNVASVTGWGGEASLAFPAVVDFWGDKDQVCIRIGNEIFVCGHVAHRWPNAAVQTTVTQSLAVTPNPVTITVASSDGFVVGHYYQILSHDPAQSGNCTDWVAVTNVAEGSLTLGELNIACASGASIGVCPLAFYHAYLNTGALVPRWTHYRNVTGDTADESYCDPKLGSVYIGSITDGRTGVYNLEPLSFHDKTYPGMVNSHYGFVLGMGDSRAMRMVSTSALTNLRDSVYTQNVLWAGEGIAAADTIAASNSFAEGELVGKTVAVHVEGSFARVGVVTANTTVSLTLDKTLCVADATAVDFIVCDYAYRDVAGVGGTGLLFLMNEGAEVPLFSSGYGDDYLRKLYVL